MWKLLTSELLKDQLAQNFQIQIPIYLDQFLEQQKGKYPERELICSSSKWGNKFKWLFHTTTRVLNFKPQDHFVIFLGQFFSLALLSLQLYFRSRPRVFLIKWKIPSTRKSVCTLAPSPKNDVTRCKVFQIVKSPNALVSQ